MVKGERMKVIKSGKPYRIHKCLKCKTTYIYHIFNDKNGDLVYCPECNNYLDFHIFDKRISHHKYINIDKVKK